MNAKVICRSCGMETGLDAYRDQIEAWMETICEKTFGDSEQPILWAYRLKK